MANGCLLDDRVRNIALAMGLIPIIWTRTPSGAQMDTEGEASTGYPERAFTETDMSD